MSPVRPLTYAFPINARPTRTLIVSDPRKLDYFAQANAVRMGVFHSAGALSGLGDGAPANTTAAEPPGVLSLLDKIAGIVGNLTGGSGKMQQVVATPPPEPDSTILGLPPAVAVIGGLALVGGVGYLVFKKR